MTLLIIGCILFFGIHLTSAVWPNVRAAAINRMGENRWKLLYTLVAAAGLILMIIGYGNVRFQSDDLYVPPGAGRHVAMLLMLPVFPLLVAAYMPGRIQRAVRHPMLWATVLWAAAHLLANGRVADVILFGTFGIWALFVLLSYQWRPARAIHQAPPRKSNDAVAIVAGLLIYVVFLFAAHQWIAGIPLFAR